MRKKQSKAEPDVTASDNEKDRLWHEHIRECILKGIEVKYKPVRFHTSKEQDQREREYYALTEPPGYDDINGKPP